MKQIIHSRIEYGMDHLIITYNKNKNTRVVRDVSPILKQDIYIYIYIYIYSKYITIIHTSTCYNSEFHAYRRSSGN